MFTGSSINDSLGNTLNTGADVDIVSIKVQEVIAEFDNFPWGFSAWYMFMKINPAILSNSNPVHTSRTLCLFNTTLDQAILIVKRNNPIDKEMLIKLIQSAAYAVIETCKELLILKLTKNEIRISPVQIRSPKHKYSGMFVIYNTNVVSVRSIIIKGNSVLLCRWLETSKFVYDPFFVLINTQIVVGIIDKPANIPRLWILVLIPSNEINVNPISMGKNNKGCPTIEITLAILFISIYVW